MQIITKHPRLEIGLREISQSSELWEGQRGQEVQVSRRFDLWIELDFDNNNNRVNFYQFKHYPDDYRKSVEESC